jgi:ubiquinone/menaquinone biosynthesis C-methylase UbiE
VLRPGGLGLTRQMLDHAGIGGSEVVELAPGLGRTAMEILGRSPASYTGVEEDEDAARLTAKAVGSTGTVVQADASQTGFPDASVDLVIGEAMLTMQSDTAKRAIVAEAVRILRPGGRYAIHELGLHPDDLGPEIKTELRKDLARVIKVNARPQTIAEWRALLEEAGLIVGWTGTAPMALLRMPQPR